MKKLVILIGLVALFAACQDEVEISNIAENPDSEIKVNDQSKLLRGQEPKKYIFHVSWVNGWKLPDCNKFGICAPESCWFCCFENGVQVPCPENNGMINYNAGEVSIDAHTGRGSMVFYLDPNDPKHEQMIANQEDCRLVQNFDLEEYELLAGDYKYNPEIGEYGGYIIQARLK